MRHILWFILLILSNGVFAQTNTSDTLRVLAKQITLGEGSKIHVAKFQIIQDLSGRFWKDTISIAYSGHSEPSFFGDTVALKLIGVEDQNNTWYQFPDFLGTEHTQKVTFDEVPYGLWSGCETGETTCPTIVLSKPDSTSWWLQVPCGGTHSSITLYNKSNEVLQQYGLMGVCPPYLPITDLDVGIYRIKIVSCAMGGTVTLEVK